MSEDLNKRAMTDEVKAAVERLTHIAAQARQDALSAETYNPRQVAEYVNVYATIETVLRALSRLTEENERMRGDPERGLWWTKVVGEGASHVPSGEVRSIKHLHPAMVQPIYEAHKGTAVADVIAGLVFHIAITENRERFLVADATDRRTKAEAERDEALEALSTLLERCRARGGLSRQGYAECKAMDDAAALLAREEGRQSAGEITEAMVDAGARAIDLQAFRSDTNGGVWELQRAAARVKARDCLKAALLARSAQKEGA